MIFLPFTTLFYVLVVGPLGPTNLLGLLLDLRNYVDNQREIAYDAGAEKALELATQRGWAVASVRDDWLTVFAEV